jgi:hypothetical protein
MKDFKKFFEDDNMALVPQGNYGSLELFMDTLIGSTIDEISNKRTYIGLYMGNKYGLGGAGGGKDKAIEQFVESLLQFVNRDDQGRGPHSPDGGFRPRVYETDEFKTANNYEEYQALDQQRRQAFKAKFIARKEKDDVALAAANELYDDVTSQMNNSQFGVASRAAHQEEDEYVKRLHNTPFTKEKLGPDGSPEYEQLRQAFDQLQQYYT